MRLTRIEGVDLNLFRFDLDLTMMVFFLNADEKVYARYGGRDAEGPDERQSLEGLRYTMQSVLQMHGRKEKEFAPRDEEAPRYSRDLTGTRGFRRCFHCHQVREALDAELQRTGKWRRDLAWRYPLPDNLGCVLEVDRGNVVARVVPDSPAARAGLARGDVVRRLDGVPVHSIGDAQFALDRAPAKGAVDLSWRRGDKTLTGKLALAEGWRKSDVSWRPSMQRLMPTAPLYGRDLTAAEKKALGLGAKQLAFRQEGRVSPRAQAAGVRAGDVVLGVDDKKLENMDATDFRLYVHREYLVGERVTLNVLRDGKPLRLSMTLRRR